MRPLQSSSNTECTFINFIYDGNSSHLWNPLVDIKAGRSKWLRSKVSLWSHQSEVMPTRGLNTVAFLTRMTYVEQISVCLYSSWKTNFWLVVLMFANNLLSLEIQHILEEEGFLNHRNMETWPQQHNSFGFFLYHCTVDQMALALHSCNAWNPINLGGGNVWVKRSIWTRLKSCSGVDLKVELMWWLLFATCVQLH